MKIFTFMPLNYREPADIYFQREAGLLSLGLEKLGVKSRCVLLGKDKEYVNYPLITSSYEKVCSAKWWEQHSLDGVIMWSWFNPAYLPFVQAIKKAGIKLFMRTDSNGLVSNFREGQAYYGDQFCNLNFYGLVRSAYHDLFPFYNKKLIRYLSYGDFVSIESPLALETLRMLYRSYNREDLVARSFFIPAPVTSDCKYDSSMVKNNCIISIGRWESFQKNTPLLVSVLGKILDSHKEYHADIIGSGEKRLGRLLRSIPFSVRSRIHVRGNIPHSNLASHYQHAKICFMPSRFESSCLVAEEALCCGCSLVGPERVRAFNYYILRKSGTVGTSYNTKGLQEALEDEINAWGNGKRNPEEIAFSWQKEFHAENVSRKILEIFNGRNE